MNTLAQVQTGKRHTGALFLGVYLGIYAAMLFVMHRTSGFDVLEPILVFAILGVGFSVAAWLFSARVTPLPIAVRTPDTELVALFAYLVPLVAFVTWGFAFLHRRFPSDPSDAIAILTAKLAAFVILPAAIMRWRFGYRLRQLAPLSARPSHLLVALGMAFLAIGFQAVAGRGLRDIAQNHVSRLL